MASGAGSNLVSLYLLQSVNATGLTPNTTPTATYGTIGVNDSGGWCGEGRGFSKGSFQLIPIGSGLVGVTVQLFVCTSPDAWQTWWNAIQGPGSPFSGRPYGGPSAVNLPVQGFTNAAAGYVPGVDPQAWTPMPGPSEQGGTGGIANPLTTTTPFLVTSFPKGAVRAVVTAVAGGAGRFSVSAELIP
jgi:hypothetical protein